MSAQVYWMLELSIHDGKYDQATKLIAEMVKATEENEPNTLQYDYWESADKKSCHIFERYTDSAAVMTHMGNFGANFAERFMGVFSPVRFTVYGNASDEVRKTLADFQPAYMSAIDGFIR